MQAAAARTTGVRLEGETREVGGDSQYESDDGGWEKSDLDTERMA